MGRRRNESLLDDLISLPWWFGAIGIVIILILRKAWLAWLYRNDSASMIAPVLEPLSHIFYALAFVFAVGAIASFIRQKSHGRLLQKSTDEKSINNLSWQQFEGLLQEAFRRQGYLSVETGSGADGGVDIALRKEGKRYLAQCKHWKSQKVGVTVVRELWGVISASGAEGGFVITSGRFTGEAQKFASQVRIELIDGQKLKRMLKGLRSETSKPVAPQAPSCPKCQRTMIHRVAKRGPNQGNAFWGCSAFPQCKGVLSISQQN